MEFPAELEDVESGKIFLKLSWLPATSDKTVLQQGKELTLDFEDLIECIKDRWRDFFGHFLETFYVTFRTPIWFDIKMHATLFLLMCNNCVLIKDFKSLIGIEVL